MSINKNTLDEYNVLNPEVRANPYPLYERLRLRDPVHWSESLNGWLVTRYADVVSAIRDPRLSSGGGVSAMFDRLPTIVQEELLPLRRQLSMWMGTLDPPDHTRIRSLTQKALTPCLKGLRPFIEAVTDKLIDMVEDAGQMDVVRDLAYPLPAIVIARILGAPSEDRERFRKWSEDITAFFGHGFSRTDVMRRAQESVLEMTNYIGNLVTQHRQNPDQKDLITGFIAAEEREQLVSEEEVLANCVLLLFAGHETTSILIGNSLLALLQNGDQLRKLKDDPTLIVSAIEEFMRYDTPVQMIRRLAKQDLDIGIKRIKKGQIVWLMLGSANRDPEQFLDPERLDITRMRNGHLSFGTGTHYCLGAALANLETQVVITTVLKRLPTLRLETSTLEWLDNPTAHALKSLPINF